MDTWDELKAALKKETDNNRGAMTELAEHLGQTIQYVNVYLTTEKNPNYTLAMKMRNWLDERQKKKD